MKVLEAKALQIISEKDVRQRRSRRRLSSTDADYETALHDRIQEACFGALNIVMSEIKRRFEENDDILRALCDARKMDIDLLKPLTTLKRIELPNENELQVAKDYVDAQILLSLETGETEEMEEVDRMQMIEPEEGDEVNEMDEEGGQRKINVCVLQHLYPVRAAFPKVFKIFCAIETFPCSTTISECSFSCLARVGILGRIHMTNERLRNLSFLAFEKKRI